ncbi:hypothetical protein, partial [Streptomyces beihaiensis]
MVVTLLSGRADAHRAHEHRVGVGHGVGQAAAAHRKEQAAGDERQHAPACACAYQVAGWRRARLRLADR